MIRKRTLLHWLTLVCIIIATVTGTVFAKELPFTASDIIYIQDDAKVLSYDAKMQMQGWSESTARDTGAQLIVKTVKTTGSVPIKQYGDGVLREWEIGEGKKEGLLLLVAVDDRKSYIGVGEELKKTFTDDKIAELQNQYILPAFREGEYNYHIWQGYCVILKETRDAYQLKPGELGKKSHKYVASSARTEGIYVHDYAKVIDSQIERKIQMCSERLDKRTRAQIVVVTIDTTGDVPIEQYSLDLFRKWGIGDKEKNNGVLMLVAVKDRKSRIEVGYGLEGALNDAKTGLIQDNYMIPAFRQADHSKGIAYGYEALVREVAKEYQIPIEELIESQTRATEDQRQFKLGKEECVMLAILILLMLIDMKVTGGRFTHIFLRIVIIILSRGRSGFGGGKGGGGGSSRSW